MLRFFLFLTVIVSFVSAGRAEEAVEVVCVGDVMLAYGLKDVLVRKGPAYPFKRVRALLRNADIVFGNLENPIANQGERFPDKAYNFLMDPPLTFQLRRTGFQVMSVANNHILDFGVAAMMNTLDLLKKNGIAACGAGLNIEQARRPAVLAAHGQNVAFLAYTKTYPVAFAATADKPGTAFAEDSFIKTDIARARRDNDFVIVSLHWGEEYAAEPSRAQQRLAHAVVDAGADAVVGHHPHVAQGVELYKGKIIAYSLGNFVFGTNNANAGEGLVMRLRFARGAPVEASFNPIWVDNFEVLFQPRPMPGPTARDFLSRFRALSAKLGTPVRLENDEARLP